MRRYLKTFLRQSLFSRVAAAAILIMPCLILLSELDSIKTAADEGRALSPFFSLSLMLDAFSGKYVRSVLPILCALPYTTGFLDDTESGFVKCIRIRVRRKGYLFSKELTCALSGGMVLLTGVAVSVFLTFALTVNTHWLGIRTDMIPGLLIRTGRFALLFTFNGMLLASFGMLCATLSGNRLAAYISPFVLYYLLIIFHERGYTRTLVLDPAYWISADMMSDAALVTAAGCLAAAAALVMFLHFLLMERRLENV